MDAKPKLLDLVRNTIRLKHYSIRTERAYIDWVKRFNLFHHKRRILSQISILGAKPENWASEIQRLTDS